MAIVSNPDILAALGATGTIADADQTLLTMIQPMVEARLKKWTGSCIEQATFTEYYPEVGPPDVREELVEGWEVIGDRARAWTTGEAATILALRQIPIRSITTIHENTAAWDTAGGSFPSSTLLTDGTDYQLDVLESGLSWTGHILRRSGSWTRVARAVKVVYVAGFTAAELTSTYPEIKLATLVAIIKAFNEMKAHQGYATGTGGAGPIVSETLGKYSVTFAESAVEQLSALTMDLPKESKRLLEDYMSYTRYLR